MKLMTFCSVHAMASQTFTFPLPRSERVILLASWLVGLALPGMWVRLVLRKAHVALRELPHMFASSVKLQVIAALAVLLYAAAAFVAVWYMRVARGTRLTVTDEGFTWFVPGAPLSGGGEQKVSVVWAEVRRLRLRTLRSYRYQTFALTVETDQGTVDLDLLRLRGDGLVARKRREGIAAFANHMIVERFAEATGLAVERGA
jgi:hypothetical protein